MSFLWQDWLWTVCHRFFFRQNFFNPLQGCQSFWDHDDHHCCHGQNQRLKTVYSMIAVILPMGRFPERLWKPPNPKMLRMDSPMKKCTAGFKTANKRLTWIITFAYPSKVWSVRFFETSFVKGANHPYACIGFTQNPHHSIYFFCVFFAKGIA